MKAVDLSIEPDLRPIYPTAATISPLLSSNFGLAPAQKSELVKHCLIRACTFGDVSTLTYLLLDANAQAYVDLSYQDEDGMGLAGIAIHGFGSDSDRDVEREECVRLLIAQGVDVNHVDRCTSQASLFHPLSLTIVFGSEVDSFTPCSITSSSDLDITSSYTWMLPFCAHGARAHPSRHCHRSRDHSWT